MKIVLTESQLKYVFEQETEDLCTQDFVDFVNSHLDGVVRLTPDEVYSTFEDPMEVLKEIPDAQKRSLAQRALENISKMTLEQKGQELRKLFSNVKGLKEQQTPYMDQTYNIAGVEMPRVAVDSVVGLVAIGLLSSIINKLGEKMDAVKPSRRSGRNYIIGCQGARSRAKAVRRRRRRENWKGFLRRIGLK